MRLFAPLRISMGSELRDSGTDQLRMMNGRRMRSSERGTKSNERIWK